MTKVALERELTQAHATIARLESERQALAATIEQSLEADPSRLETVKRVLEAFIHVMHPEHFARLNAPPASMYGAVPAERPFESPEFLMLRHLYDLVR